MKKRITLTCCTLFTLSCSWLQAVPAVVKPQADELAILQVGNLVYGKQQSSVCFADTFLSMVTEMTNLDLGEKFIPVELGSPDLFDLPFCIFSGEGEFSLTEAERQNLRTYLQSGGFILASPSCSNPKWDKSFRNELKLCLPEEELEPIPMNHPIFSMVNQIDKIVDKKGKPVFLKGIHLNGRLVMVHSPEGLNDVKNAKGCCCCGGNEIKNPALINVNIFTYASVY